MIKKVKLQDIQSSPYQTREKNQVHIINLAYSILQNGLMQPPLGCIQEGKVILAYGNSRLAAHRMLNSIKTGETALNVMTTDEDMEAVVTFDMLVKEVQAQDNTFEEMEVVIEDLTEEQLFARGIAENVDRAELRPIELAKALKIYIDNFFKSSEQAGKLFRLSGSAVRNYLRLLDLPDPVQAQINQGVISQNTARKLLTVQRVAKPEDIELTVNEIIASDKSEQSIDETISRRLDSVFENSTNAKIMWDSWRSAPAKGGPGLWLLNEWTFNDAKDFAPSAFLKAYPKWSAQLSNISTRPATVIRQIQDAIMSGQRHVPTLVLDLELDPEIYSELVEQVLTIMLPPICSKCSFCQTLKTSRGLDTYCGMKFCHARKKQVFIDEQITNIAYELGIAHYVKETDGEFLPLGKNPTDTALFEARDDSLRIRLEIQEWQPHHFTNSHIAQIVKVGKAYQEAQEAKERSAQENRERLGVGAYRDYQAEMASRSQRMEMEYDFVYQKLVPLMMPTLKKIPKNILPLLVKCVENILGVYPEEMPEVDSYDELEEDLLQKIIGYATIIAASSEEMLYMPEFINATVLQDMVDVMRQYGVDVSTETLGKQAAEFQIQYLQPQPEEENPEEEKEIE